MYEEFTAMTQGIVEDYNTNVIPIETDDYGTMMCICSEEGAIYITKDQAIKFFNLGA